MTMDNLWLIKRAAYHKEDNDFDISNIPDYILSKLTLNACLQNNIKFVMKMPDNVIDPITCIKHAIKYNNYKLVNYLISRFCLNIRDLVFINNKYIHDFNVDAMINWIKHCGYHGIPYNYNVHYVKVSSLWQMLNYLDLYYKPFKYYIELIILLAVYNGYYYFLECLYHNDKFKSFLTFDCKLILSYVYKNPHIYESEHYQVIKFLHDKCNYDLTLNNDYILRTIYNKGYLWHLKTLFNKHNKKELLDIFVINGNYNYFYLFAEYFGYENINQDIIKTIIDKSPTYLNIGQLNKHVNIDPKDLYSLLNINSSRELNKYLIKILPLEMFKHTPNYKNNHVLTDFIINGQFWIIEKLHKRIYNKEICIKSETDAFAFRHKIMEHIDQLST